MKLEHYAQLIEDQGSRREFLNTLKRHQDAFEKITELLMHERGYTIPLVSEEDICRMKVVVHGKPSREEWMRLGAFASLASGDFEVNAPPLAEKVDGARG